jgi:hypothetical protein
MNGAIVLAWHKRIVEVKNVQEFITLPSQYNACALRTTIRVGFH